LDQEARSRTLTYYGFYMNSIYNAGSVTLRRLATLARCRSGMRYSF
jgi:hypothetical protein